MAIFERYDGHSVRIVVTGASGFLGRVVLRKLKEKSVDAIGLSRSTSAGLIKVSNYADSPSGDILIHLAESNDRHWANTQGSEYELSANLTLKALLERDFSRVIYASSAVLYGDKLMTPHKVEDPLYANDTYTRIKIESEKLVMSAQGVVARLSNVYGSGMSENNVLSAMLRQVDCDGPMQVLDTSPVRDFISVEDAADGLIQMAFGERAGVYNLGTGLGTSILDLANLVLQSAGQPERLVKSTSTNSPSPSHLVLDVEATATQFGWRPVVDLRCGIESLVRHLKS